MKHKLIMESWRDFLKEEGEAPGKPYDPMSGAEKLYDPEQARKNKEMMTTVLSPDESFPIVGGESFVEPIPGVLSIDASFGQTRGSTASKGFHGAIDQNVNSMRCVSISDSTVVRVTPNSWYGATMKAFQRSLKDRVYNKESKKFAGFQDFVNADSEGGSRRISSMKTLRRKVSQIKPSEASSLGNLSWPDFKNWCKRNLTYNAAASVMRYYSENRLIFIGKTAVGTPQGGIELILETSPDQNGKKYVVLYSHMASVNVKKGQKLKRGDVVGMSGDTSIFDSRPHLHFAMGLSNGFGKNEKKLDPLKLIPSLAQGKKGIYDDIGDKLPK